MTAQHNGPYLVRVEQRCEPCRGTGFVLAPPTYEGDGCADCGGTGTSHPYDESPLRPGSGWRVVSLEAVVDLRAARRVAWDYLNNAPGLFLRAPALYWAEMTRGGSYGPLPGGERITVEPTTWQRLIDDVDSSQFYVPGSDEEAAEVRAEIIAAWNERCGVKRQEAGR